MIQFEHQILSESDPIAFSLLWQANDPMGWALVDIDVIQFRRGNRWNSELVAGSTFEVSSIDPKVLIITLTDFDYPLPESLLYYDILLTNGQRFGYGSIEVKRGVSE